MSSTRRKGSWSTAEAWAEEATGRRKIYLANITDEVDRLLSGRSEPSTGAMFSPPTPRTVERAAGSIGANLAVVSVPGPHAFVEAMAALEGGKLEQKFPRHRLFESKSLAARILVLTSFATDDKVFPAIKAGAANRNTCQKG